MATPIGCLDTEDCLFGTEGATSVPLSSSPVLGDQRFPQAGVTYFSAPLCEGGDACDAEMLGRSDLEALLGCCYAHHLLFETKAELRGRGEWAYAPPVSPSMPFGKLQSSDAVGCDSCLRNGTLLYESLCVRRVGIVDGVDVGLGLFALNTIEGGTFLGEYTGVVRRRQAEGDNSIYGYALPVIEPDLVVCAARYGNLCRLMNHSDEAWNAELLAVHHEGLPHVVCRAVRDIRPGEQVLINYGSAYWSSPGRRRAALL